MFYLTEPVEIKTAIDRLALHKVLWVDTETAFWNTPAPQLSLIQVSADENDRTGEFSYVLDVFNIEELSQYFITRIMADGAIEKVFHNAGYDLKFLGRNQAKNITCTLKISKKITRQSLGVPDLKLKTLARQLGNFSSGTIDLSQQESDWSRRPLTTQQLHYASMDVIYLSHVHRYLTKFISELYGLSSVDRDLLQEYLPVMIEEIRPVKPLTCQDKPDSETRPEPLIHPTITIEDIYLAHQCGRFVYLESKNPQNLEFVSNYEKGIVSGIFSQVADDLIKIIQQDPCCKILFEPEAQQLNNENITRELQSLLYKIYLFPYLQEAIKKDKHKATLINQAWISLKKLILLWTDILVSNRYYCNASDLFDKTFLSHDPNINHTFELPGGQQQPILGKLTHSLYKLDDRTLHIPTYPLNDLEYPASKEARLSLQAYLVHQSRNIPIKGVIEWQFPEVRETLHSWQQMEGIIADIIPRLTSKIHGWFSWKHPAPYPPRPSQEKLCQICPKTKECINVFGITEPPEPPEPPKPPGEGLEEIIEQLVSALKAFGVKINEGETKAIAAPAFIRVQVKPRLGVKAITIINLAEDLQVQLGFSAIPLIQPQAGYVSIDIPRPDRQIARFERYISKESATNSEATFKIAIGVNLNGELVQADLADANNCHFLVAGTSGSGKSEFLRALLLSLLARHSRENLQIVLVDPKRVTFPEFENIPWLYSPIIKDTEPAIDLMENLVAEMERRYKILEESRCNDLESYNKKVDRSPNKILSRIVCIFDEYADFMIDKESKNSLENSIKRLGAKARAAGIHLIIATQRPDATVVTPLIRANLPARVALKTASGGDSAIILGDKQTDAFRLLGKGDLLYLTGGKLLRLQSLYAENCQL
ncbi:MAG: Ribonuclease D [Chroococcopsis gigantea SAG 12.99]|jgi:S-DNA-T family DNA segregation ATPase FtsK/SpoIIIE|nr:Ribonuclease D [Chroococcopsis gigantea SAG 12.99]